MTGLSGRVATVTGGTSGLGAAVVAKLTAAGVRVAACGLERPADPVPDVLYSYHDVRLDSDMAAFVDATMAALGPPTLAVNCAGISHHAAKAADIASEVMADVLATNALGVFHAMRHQIPVMLAQGRGAVVNIASTLSGQGAGWMAAYGASKHAVVGLTLSAALDYGPHNLRINAVSPGPMKTPMFDRAIADIAGDLSKYAGGLPPGGPADPATVAGAIVFLLSDAAAGINGTNLFADQLVHAGGA